MRTSHLMRIRTLVRQMFTIAQRCAFQAIPREMVLRIRPLGVISLIRIKQYTGTHQKTVLISSVSAQMTQSRSEEHTSELQSLMRTSYAVFCLKKKINNKHMTDHTILTIEENT